MKKLVIKLSSIFVVLIFLVMAYGSGDDTSEIKNLSTYSHEAITEVLSASDLTDFEDYGGLRYDIVLKMNSDNTFEYSIEATNNDTRDYTKATGSFEYIGNVEKVTVAYVGFQYEQLIKFTGTTHSGKRFELEGKLCQFSKDNGLESKWFFAHENYSISDGSDLSVDNYKLPDADVFP
jgi:hypothetical protein